MSSAYTKGEREFLEAMVIKNTTNIPSAKDADPGPESNLSKWLRKYCKTLGYPAWILPQTKDVANLQMPPGWPDATILKPNRIIFMELKRPKGGRKSDKQNEMAILFLHLGHQIHEVKTQKRAIEIIDK